MSYFHSILASAMNCFLDLCNIEYYYNNICNLYDIDININNQYLPSFRLKDDGNWERVERTPHPMMRCERRARARYAHKRNAWLAANPPPKWDGREHLLLRGMLCDDLVECVGKWLYW